MYYYRHYYIMYIITIIIDIIRIIIELLELNAKFKSFDIDSSLDVFVDFEARLASCQNRNLKNMSADPTEVNRL